MDDEKIIEQLRKMRAFQRGKLSNELYPAYQDGLKDALRAINEEYDEILQEFNIAQEEYFKKKNQWISVNLMETQQKRDTAQKKLNTCDSKRNAIKATFEATCERNTKLCEFDIETEKIILSHVCQTRRICENESVLALKEANTESEIVIDTKKE